MSLKMKADMPEDNPHPADDPAMGLCANADDSAPDDIPEDDIREDDIMWALDAQHSLDVICADKRWAPYFDSALADDARQLVRFVSALIEAKGFQACLRWTNDEEMRALNAQFRDKDKATNVLSFPAEYDEDQADTPYLGDLAFGFETMAKEAKEMDISIQHHMRHLIIHGLLHLIGCDHEQAEDAEEMEALEIAALAVIGVANPYQGELL